VTRSATFPLFKDGLGAVANTVAMSYALGGWCLGFVLMAHGAPLLAGAGVLLTAHAMFIAAYLVHEACHDAIFKKHAHNRAAGEIMSFVAGSSYASYDRIRHLHLRHHRERLDVACFDYRAFLKRSPRFVRDAVLALEWAHVPAIETIMHLQVIVRPFVVESERRYLPRVVAMLGVRAALLVLVLGVAPSALALYAVAYALMLAALAFFDAFQHTYVCYYEPGAPPPDRSLRSREYEQRNTFSNLVSVKYPWLNLLALNFGYHNAHHERAGTPWYRLPALHRTLPSHDAQVLPVRQLLRTFHANRVRRVFEEDYGAVAEGPTRADSFVGAHGVSLLSVV